MSNVDTEAITPEEWERLRPRLTPYHWQVYYWLLWETGIRPGEALNLTRGDIALKGSQWSIQVRRLKKRSGERIDTITLPSDLGKAVWGLTSPRARLKPFPYRIQSANEALKRAAQKACVRESIHPHLFRHGFGRRWARMDLGYSATDHVAILKEMLGHSRMATTEIYFRPSSKEVEGAWDKLRAQEKPAEDDWQATLKKRLGLSK